MSTFVLKKRDTLPILEVVLLDDKDDPTSVHDLTGATASLHVRLPDGSVFTRTMGVDGVPTTGIVRYTFLATDWTGGAPVLTSGMHPMEVEVLVGAGRQSFPSDGDDRLIIPSDIGQA